MRKAIGSSLFFALFVFVFSIFSSLQAFAIGQWTPTGSLNNGHFSQPLLTLPSGQVLMMSGGSTSVEAYNVTTGSWDMQGSVLISRARFNPVVLNDGRVLVAGGNSSTFNELASAEIYDPATGVSTPTGSLNTARICASFVKLQDGRVLAISGNPSPHFLKNAVPTSFVSTEIYDPATGAWSYTGTMLHPISDCDGSSSILLNDGRVLVVGDTAVASSTETQLYDPATGLWSAGGNLAVARSTTNMVKLASGDVLIAGGDQFNAPQIFIGSTKTVADAEIFDPTTNTWHQTGSLHEARSGAGLLRTPDNRAFIAGGGNNNSPVLSSEFYDPVAGQWTLDATLNGDHVGGKMALLTSGKVLMAGGLLIKGSPSTTTVSELYSFLALSPTSKEDCNNNLWQSFTNPVFKSQGDCVQYVNSL